MFYYRGGKGLWGLVKFCLEELVVLGDVGERKMSDVVIVKWLV